MNPTPKKSQRVAASEVALRLRQALKEAEEEEEEEEQKEEEDEPPLPMLELDDDIESELPIRGRPSKKLLLQKQQMRAQITAKSEPKSSVTPTNSAALSISSGRSKAKRSLYKKGSNTTAQKSHSESYVMRLFERSLDLSKYKDTTPLYPICRAWMANQPRNPNVAVFNTDGSVPIVKREGDAEEVLAKLLSGQMKVLKEMPKSRKTEMSSVPSRLPSGQDEKLQGASKDELMSDNMTHWKRVRSHWLEHSQKYETERFEIIDQIMEAVCKRE